MLTNHHGTAPGIWLEDTRHQWVAMLPGVPREMREMVREAIMPRLLARGIGTPVVVRSRTLRTTGLAESAVAERLGDLAGGIGPLSLAYLPGVDGVDLRLTARGLPEPDAERLLLAGTMQLRERVGRFAYGEDSADLAAVVLEACRSRHVRLAVGESCTGGVLGARLTAIPGSSAVFVGGVIAYDNAVKHTMLDVSERELQTAGAVSESVALAMARGARSRGQADIGVAITGIAGPDGGSPDKPVGTVWIAVAGPQSASGDPDDGVARRAVFVGDREEIRYRAAQAALDMVRRRLTD